MFNCGYTRAYGDGHKKLKYGDEFQTENVETNYICREGAGKREVVHKVIEQSEENVKMDIGIRVYIEEVKEKSNYVEGFGGELNGEGGIPNVKPDEGEGVGWKIAGFIGSSLLGDD